MYFNRVELKDNAKQFLRQHYIFAFIVCAIILIICGKDTIINIQFHYNSGFDFSFTGLLSLLSGFVFFIFALIIGIILRLFLFNPLGLGKKKYFISEETDSIRDLFFAFTSEHYFNIIKTLLIKDIIIFLYSLLFLIPGIIKYYELRMVDYILAEQPMMETKDIFLLSKQMTKDKKMDIFYLDLSFIGWLIIGGLFGGIPLFFIQPYLEATYAQLFFKLKNTQPAYLYGRSDV